MKTRYDFKAIRAMAKNHGIGYYVHCHNYIAYNLTADGQTWLISHKQNSMLQAHNNATMELRSWLISKGFATETDFIIK